MGQKAQSKTMVAFTDVYGKRCSSLSEISMCEEFSFMLSLKRQNYKRISKHDFRSMAQPIWSWLYLGVCDGLLFLESWGLVNWSPAFFLYIF